jgi:polysaccharide pyruvyl transferase WcaK-like protein
MHATIGALSSKVPTIPFSYSKKFEGLFESVEYPYTIKALDIDTKEAYLETVRYIDEVEEIKKNVEYSSKIVDLKIIALKEWFASIFTGGKK